MTNHPAYCGQKKNFFSEMKRPEQTALNKLIQAAAWKRGRNMATTLRQAYCMLLMMAASSWLLHQHHALCLAQ
jgi:predicted transcriptional regulator of viral defense system